MSETIKTLVSFEVESDSDPSAILVAAQLVLSEYAELIERQVGSPCRVSYDSVSIEPEHQDVSKLKRQVGAARASVQRAENERKAAEWKYEQERKHVDGLNREVRELTTKLIKLQSDTRTAFVVMREECVYTPPVAAFHSQELAEESVVHEVSGREWKRTTRNGDRVARRWSNGSDFVTVYRTPVVKG